MKKYDMIVIGLGPAGMALAAMGTAMGLDVLAVEKNKIEGVNARYYAHAARLSNHCFAE